MTEMTLALALRLVIEKILRLLEELECDNDEMREIFLELHGILSYVEDDDEC